jgi:hypothetical protein
VGTSDPEVRAAALALLTAELERCGARFQATGSVVEVTEPECFSVYVDELVRVLRHAPLSEWRRAVAERVRIGLEARTTIWATVERPYEEVAPQLRIRVVSQRTAERSGPIVGRPVAGDLLEALAVPVETSVVLVNPAQERRWGRPPEELFAVARRNTRETEPFAVRQVPEVGFDLAWLQGGGEFEASHVLWLDSVMELPAGGAVVTVPTRYHVLVLKVEEGVGVQELATLVTLTQGLFESGEGPLSRNAYWWHQGRLRAFGVAEGTGVSAFAAPAGLLRRLPGMR